MMRRILPLLSLVALPAALSAQEDISIGYNSGTGMATCCAPVVGDATRAAGQTFTVPLSTFSTLESFSFWSTNAPTSMKFQAFLYEWDSANKWISGNALYTSDVRTGGDAVAELLAPGVTGYRYDFSTGGIGLDANQQYIAFLGSWGLGSTASSNMFHPYLGMTNGPYQGGNLFAAFGPAGASLAGAASNPWSEYSAWDLLFEADFSDNPPASVPEPTSAVLWLIAALGLGLTGIARRIA